MLSTKNQGSFSLQCSGFLKWILMLGRNEKKYEKRKKTRKTGVLIIAIISGKYLFQIRNVKGGEVTLSRNIILSLCTLITVTNTCTLE